MSLFGRIGNVAENLLGPTLQSQENRRQEAELARRQAALSEQNMFQDTASKIADEAVRLRKPLTEDQLAQIDAKSPEVGKMIRMRMSASMPSDAQAASASGAPVLKSIADSKSDEELGSEDARLAEAKSAFGSANVPLTAGDDNPMWGVQDAYQAQRKQIGANSQTARDEALADAKVKEQSQYDINHPPEGLVYLHKDASGNAKASILDPSAQGGFRPVTAEDLKRPYKVHEGQPQASSVYSNMDIPDEAMDVVAQRYLFVDGKEPTSRNPAVQQAFYNSVGKLTKWAQENHIPLSPGAASANFAALRAAGVNLTTRAQATAAAQKTAVDNLDLVLKASPQVSRTDSAWVNAHVLNFVRGATEAADLSDFEVKAYTAAREYAKVVTGSTQSVAELSATAAQKAEELLSSAKSPKALTASIAAMKADMQNFSYRQMEGANNVAGLLRGLIPQGAGGNDGGAAVSAPPQRIRKYNPATGRVE